MILISLLFFSIEEDYVTWLDKFWSAVCEYYGISASEQDLCIRQYQLIAHNDILPEKVYKGEVTRLNSYVKQRPYAFYF